MYDIFSDPRLILCDEPRLDRVCQTCHGSSFAFDDEGYLMDCPGPCRGTGRTDLPLPEEME